MKASKVFLHIGCGPYKHEGFINTDKEMDITKPWPYENSSVDGIVSMHVLQELSWRQLEKAFRESYRVLKKGGIMRLGVPAVELNWPLSHLLGWGNINLFSYDLLKKVLIDCIGYWDIKSCKYKESAIKEFINVDNRPESTLYIEVKK